MSCIYKISNWIPLGLGLWISERSYQQGGWRKDLNYSQNHGCLNKKLILLNPKKK